jgi:hypothetical protein
LHTAQLVTLLTGVCQLPALTHLHLSVVNNPYHSGWPHTDFMNTVGAHMLTVFSQHQQLSRLQSLRLHDFPINGDAVCSLMRQPHFAAANLTDLDITVHQDHPINNLRRWLSTTMHFSCLTSLRLIAHNNHYRHILDGVLTNQHLSRLQNLQLWNLTSMLNTIMLPTSGLINVFSKLPHARHLSGVSSPMNLIFPVPAGLICSELSQATFLTGLKDLAIGSYENSDDDAALVLLNDSPPHLAASVNTLAITTESQLELPDTALIRGLKSLDICSLESNSDLVRTLHRCAQLTKFTTGSIIDDPIISASEILPALELMSNLEHLDLIIFKDVAPVLSLTQLSKLTHLNIQMENRDIPMVIHGLSTTPFTNLQSLSLNNFGYLPVDDNGITVNIAQLLAMPHLTSQLTHLSIPGDTNCMQFGIFTKSLWAATSLRALQVNLQPLI